MDNAEIVIRRRDLERILQIIWSVAWEYQVNDFYNVSNNWSRAAASFHGLLLLFDSSSDEGALCKWLYDSAYAMADYCRKVKS